MSKKKLKDIGTDIPLNESTRKRTGQNVAFSHSFTNDQLLMSILLGFSGHIQDRHCEHCEFYHISYRDRKEVPWKQSIPLKGRYINSIDR